jgi:hypothetical protein
MNYDKSQANERSIWTKDPSLLRVLGEGESADGISKKSITELKHVRNFEMLGAGNVNFPPVGILHERVV